MEGGRVDDDDDNDDERCGSMHLALCMPAGKGMMLVLDPSRPEPGRCAPGGGKERGARRRAFEVEESATIIGIDQAGQKPRGRAGAGAWWCRACWNSCTGRWINDPVDRPRWLVVVVVVVVVVVDGRGGRRGAADDGVDPAGRGRGGVVSMVATPFKSAVAARAGGTVGPGNVFPLLLLLRSRRRWRRRRLVVVVVSTTEA
jgi:hypothetical protein